MPVVLVSPTKTVCDSDLDTHKKHPVLISYPGTTSLLHEVQLMWKRRRL